MGNPSIREELVILDRIIAQCQELKNMLNDEQSLIELKYMGDAGTFAHECKNKWAEIAATAKPMAYLMLNLAARIQTSPGSFIYKRGKKVG